MILSFEICVNALGSLVAVSSKDGRTLLLVLISSPGTLQELLASKDLCFYDWIWRPFGYIEEHEQYSDVRRTYGPKNWDKWKEKHRAGITDIAKAVSEITKISQRYLTGASIFEASIAQRMSWAALRRTTRVEDQAYCLLGLFQINMPLIYGERDRAFYRLQEELVRRSTDMSIFAITVKDQKSNGLFAPDPSYFEGSGDIVVLPHVSSKRYAVTNDGMEMVNPLWAEIKPVVKTARLYLELNCGRLTQGEQPRAFQLALALRVTSIETGEPLKLTRDVEPWLALTRSLDDPNLTLDIEAWKSHTQLVNFNDRWMKVTLDQPYFVN